MLNESVKQLIKSGKCKELWLQWFGIAAQKTGKLIDLLIHLSITAVT